MPRKSKDFEKQKREWIDKPWDQARGIDTTELNNCVVLARSSVEEVSQVLSSCLPVLVPKALGKEIVSDTAAAFVFRLRGQTWTEIVYPSLGTTWETLGRGWEKKLSRKLQTRVISYGVSDTMGSIGYSLWQDGKLLEEYFAEEGEEGRPHPKSSRFSSKQRETTLADIEHTQGWANQFFKDEDAFDPGIKFEYFLEHQELQAGERAIVRNPGFTAVIEGEHILSTPEIERLDYLSAGGSNKRRPAKRQ